MLSASPSPREPKRTHRTSYGKAVSEMKHADDLAAMKHVETK